MWAALDSNQRLPPCEDASTTSELTKPQALATTPFSACTAACTSKPENANADALNGSPDHASTGGLPQAAGNLETGSQSKGQGIDQADPLAMMLAAALASLSQADRQRLGAMLLGQPERKATG